MKGSTAGRTRRCVPGPSAGAGARHSGWVSASFLYFSSRNFHHVNSESLCIS